MRGYYFQISPPGILFQACGPQFILLVNSMWYSSSFHGPSGRICALSHAFHRDFCCLVLNGTVVQLPNIFIGLRGVIRMEVQSIGKEIILNYIFLRHSCGNQGVF